MRTHAFTDSFYLTTQMPTQNEWNRLQRANKYAANTVKRDAMHSLMYEIRDQSERKVLEPIRLLFHFNFVRMNRRVDPDNIDWQRKFVLDAFVLARYIPNDNWDYVGGFNIRFTHNPNIDRDHIELLITTI